MQVEVIYVPLSVEEENGGMGCLPLLIVAMFVLIALSMICSRPTCYNH